MAFGLSSKTNETTVQPSLEERADLAMVDAAWARNSFETAANDLDAAAGELIAVRDAALAEAERLSDLALRSDDEASRHAEAASKIRALVA
ncbi:hypothetical protein AB0I95_14825 [Micromonospora sp. NPDC049751]|uniref:hypothetical protein n=1 Tax=Micromonospora sp. NPDC049751 TaxID=3154837 RepID=UPI0033E940DC